MLMLSVITQTLDCFTLDLTLNYYCIEEGGSFVGDFRTSPGTKCLQLSDCNNYELI